MLLASGNRSEQSTSDESVNILLVATSVEKGENTLMSPRGGGE
jgi:hypothetical protein